MCSLRLEAHPRLCCPHLPGFEGGLSVQLLPLPAPFSPPAPLGWDCQANPQLPSHLGTMSFRQGKDNLHLNTPASAKKCSNAAVK